MKEFSKSFYVLKIVTEFCGLLNKKSSVLGMKFQNSTPNVNWEISLRHRLVSSQGERPFVYFVSNFCIGSFRSRNGGDIKNIP